MTAKEIIYIEETEMELRERIVNLQHNADPRVQEIIPHLTNAMMRCKALRGTEPTK